MKYFSSSRGYTLLFAVLTASLVLGVAVFILSVSRKQYILSATARDSIYALYAADSGIECAAGNFGALASSSPGTINCNAGAVKPPAPTFTEFTYTDSGGIPHPNAQQTSFNLGFTYGCAVVSIVEYYDNTGAFRTIIQSRGYNICNALTFGPDITSPRIVERALQLTYQ
ncbi:MAG: hypothetical protein A3D50_00020 [Candidatus Taylorbacteria bacterium RIFCSPHIGHO2_02_FULL_44_12]|uniref:Type 4 fimbrial biogenesis protein PilX N-terminal domain-containing protein n=1 Tax=Candidatus Taylorbacteria bacterium RIFCSPHIGHO2_02_FULL_44_12 TaxID=1802308 RepID=A0A1G2MME5_9BACT|nr:MAG: hypothetical protein A3D50_00020 [Candidatus Taylorbacteria bacterium RIFCSPHIGHO2_02_FULL_44_12]